MQIIFRIQKNWINTLFENVKVLRSQLPFFAIDLVRFGKPLENKCFQNLLKF